MKSDERIRRVFIFLGTPRQEKESSTVRNQLIAKGTWPILWKKEG
jgi:hypothetical protein